MKKIICLLLIFGCLLAMVSCKKDKKESPSVEAISKIVNESSPTEIKTKVEYVVGADILTGKYTTQIDRIRGNSKFDFEYSRYATIEEMSDTRFKTVKGSVYYEANGNVSYDGNTWVPADATGYLQFNINVNEARFAKFEIVDNGNDLVSEIAPSEAKRTFGTDISADGNIKFEINTDGKYLHSTKITYTAVGSGATVVIETTYDYMPISLKFLVEEDAG